MGHRQLTDHQQAARTGSDAPFSTSWPVPPSDAVGRLVVVGCLGSGQILAWGSTYYLPAVLAEPITAETGWSRASVVGGVSLGLLVAGLVSPRIGRTVQHRGGRPVLAASAGLLALGHLGLGLAPSLAVYYAAWLVLGVAMGAGLYDAAFSTLGRLCGAGAWPSSGALIPVGRFAGTVR